MFGAPATVQIEGHSCPDSRSSQEISKRYRDHKRTEEICKIEQKHIPIVSVCQVNTIVPANVCVQRVSDVEVQTVVHAPTQTLICGEMKVARKERVCSSSAHGKDHDNTCTRTRTSTKRVLRLAPRSVNAARSSAPLLSPHGRRQPTGGMFRGCEKGERMSGADGGGYESLSRVSGRRWCFRVSRTGESGVQVGKQR